MLLSCYFFLIASHSKNVPELEINVIRFDI